MGLMPVLGQSLSSMLGTEHQHEDVLIRSFLLEMRKLRLGRIQSVTQLVNESRGFGPEAHSKASLTPVGYQQELHYFLFMHQAAVSASGPTLTATLFTPADRWRQPKHPGCVDHRRVVWCYSGIVSSLKKKENSGTGDSTDGP